jgi:amidohydrolase
MPITSTISEARSDLLALSHGIHDKPELGYEEHHAHGVLTEFLAQSGFDVQRGALGLPTAFVATAGSGDPHIAILCEYDALPGIGHGCGHNVIASAGVGAGLAVAQALTGAGTVQVIGTPAEEYGGGKIELGRRGAFDDIDVAMMIHPGDLDLIRMETLARHEVTATYRGRAAHAASAPHQGINALDAAVLGYVGISALRQQILPTDRIHGVFREGGVVPNIIPDLASTEWNVRSLDADRLKILCKQVGAALGAGASASGCSVEMFWGNAPYAEMRDHPGLLTQTADIARGIGRELVEPADGARVSGSTDMGNVSQRVPAIHPILQAAEHGTALHSSAFAEQANGALADQAVLDGAALLAELAHRLIAEPQRTTELRSTDPYDRTPWRADED